MWINPTEFTIVDGQVLYSNRPINMDHIITFDEAVDGDEPIESNEGNGNHYIHEKPQRNNAGVCHPLLGRFPAIRFYGANGKDWFWFYKSTADRDDDLKRIEKQIEKREK